MLDAHEPKLAATMPQQLKALAKTHISDTEAGGLTLKGVAALCAKLPLMHGLRELRLLGLGGASWSNALQEGAVASLAAALATLPSLQVRSCSGVIDYHGNAGLGLLAVY